MSDYEMLRDKLLAEPHLPLVIWPGYDITGEEFCDRFVDEVADAGEWEDEWELGAYYLKLDFDHYDCGSKLLGVTLTDEAKIILLGKEEFDYQELRDTLVLNRNHPLEITKDMAISAYDFYFRAKEELIEENHWPKDYYYLLRGTGDCVDKMYVTLTSAALNEALIKRERGEISFWYEPDERFWE